MFLKRMELQGFKSFADKTSITFDSDIIGIVGPNGCGKSNITDAIRWVLGEQSVKSLRGSNMSDVIFNGANQRTAVNLAEVTLVFDNTNHLFKLPYEEVAITRRLHRINNEGEYFINRTPCRRKDIIDLIMDTGLGRDSLSIITQGNISAFAEAKPEERRALFEEAAGVAKYQKRKMESLGKLSKTQDNLTRLDDILIELKHQIEPLQQQAEKAIVYLEKKAKLEVLEVSVLVEEIEFFNEQLKEIEAQLMELKTNKILHEKSILATEDTLESLRQEVRVLDEQTFHAQQEYTKVNEEIRLLEIQKIEVDEKRKYQLSMESLEHRMQQLQLMMNEAKFEYEDRKQRVMDIEQDIKFCKEESMQLENNLQQLNKQYSIQSTRLQKLYNKKEVLDQAMKQPYAHQHTIQTVLDARIQGIYGVVSSILTAIEGYELAISHTLGSANYHIVSVDEKSARDAIQYLKKNQSGRATFLPLTVLKKRFVSQEHLQLLQSCSGYLGVASSFVTCDICFELVKESLCGNVLIVDTLEHANIIAKLLKYQYKIVTLDGDVVNRGGSMTGGSSKVLQTPITIKKDLASIELKIERLQHIVEEENMQIQKLQHQRQQHQTKLVQQQIALAKLEPILQVKQAKYEKLKIEYEQLDPQQHSEQGPVDHLVIRLSELHKEIDQINMQIKQYREQRMIASSQLEDTEVLLRDERKALSIIQEQQRHAEIQQAKLETKLDTILDRLRVAYEMTYTFAKTKKIAIDMEVAKKDVAKLRQEIAALGNVNVDAIQEVEEVSNRYIFLQSQKDELLYAKDKILQAIDEMDEQMKIQFMDMFHKINHELKDVFRSLFGGGKANLFLTDPDDILHSGIDIEVQPPGKTVQNLKLFSGGEKSLIAISVLFSILLARTIPLCVFDEVEAALDQANVERFAKYLGRFRSKSQFIVVTHRPGTMAQCDALYGVTMQQSGVSKVLNVQLQEAMRYIKKG